MDCLGGCGCDCPNPDCRTEICDYCGESYDMVHEDHICPPRCPECKDFTLKPLKNYQSFMIYKCEKCKKEFGEDEVIIYEDQYI